MRRRLLKTATPLGKPRPGAGGKKDNFSSVLVIRATKILKAR
jgi:hypothetical protein